MKRTAIKVAAPLVAVLTLMVGLRIGAGEAVRAAVLFGAPRGRAAPDGSTRLAWQVLTFIDDRGVKETVALREIVATARAGGHESRWTGATNADGIAEVAWTFDHLSEGESLDVEIRVSGDRSPLASGQVAWIHSPFGERSTPSADANPARPTVRTGDIGLDVWIEGGRLITGFPTRVWVHATPQQPPATVALAFEAQSEAGLLPERESATSCGLGWAVFSMTAQAHVTGATFLARPALAAAATPAAATPAAATPSSGRWFGALPVAAGAFFIDAPSAVREGTASTVDVIAPNPRDVVYIELDDTQGRVIAAALPLETVPGQSTPRARFELPALAAGLYWLVASGEPRGAETMAGAAASKAFIVGDGRELLLNANDACGVGSYLAQHPATGVPRWVALDGLPARSASNRFRHRLGLLMGLASLLAAGVLETLLLLADSRETRLALQLAEFDETDPSAIRVTAKTPGGSAVIAILLVVLGLALLAVLLVAKG